jgi:hypothetical protein
LDAQVVGVSGDAVRDGIKLGSSSNDYGSSDDHDLHSHIYILNASKHI